ncbi:transposase [Streptomyces lydicus]|uniref:transposase n=1 Tax=Streptomyces lydicus TaxID=47763 RepID=UPI003793CC22
MTSTGLFVSVDSTIVRAISTPPGPSNGASVSEPADRALGRSRGGLTTKIYLAADSRCRPLTIVLTPGQAGDAPAFEQVMARLWVPRRVGRPRIRPALVLADKAYSSRAIRCHLRRRGIRAVIPQPADQAANRKRLGRRGGRPSAFDREAGAWRSFGNGELSKEQFESRLEGAVHGLEEWLARVSGAYAPLDGRADDGRGEPFPSDHLADQMKRAARWSTARQMVAVLS